MLLAEISESQLDTCWENVESISMRWNNAVSISAVSEFEKFNCAHSHVMRHLYARLCVMETRYDNVVVREWTRSGFIYLNITKLICVECIDEMSRCFFFCQQDVDMCYEA